MNIALRKNLVQIKEKTSEIKNITAKGAYKNNGGQHEFYVHLRVQNNNKNEIARSLKCMLDPPQLLCYLLIIVILILKNETNQLVLSQKQ